MATKLKLELRRLRKPALLLLLIATWVSVLGVLALYIVPDFSSPPVTFQSLQRLRMGGVRYTLTTDSLNLDTRTVGLEFIATADVVFEELVKPSPKGERKLITGAQGFETMASPHDLGFFIFDKHRDMPTVPSDEVGEKLGLQWEERGHPYVQVFGEPRLYPFDEYYLVGWIGMPAYVKWEDGTVYSLNSDQREYIVFENRDPRFVLNSVGAEELLANILPPKGFIPETVKEARKKIAETRWNRRNYFALKLTRPVFLKVLAVVFLIASILWLAYIVLAKHEGAPVANVLVYLAALWAVRDILSGKSEVFPTVVDYVVLVLYVAALLVVITRATLGWARGGAGNS